MCCGEPARSRSSGLDGAGLAALWGPATDAGVGWTACHHGELLQGVFADENRESDHALVTLPLRSRGSRATFRTSSESTIRVFPPDRTKARRAAELAVELCARQGDTATGGRLDIISNVPVGRGMGSSTSDVIATIKAVSDCYRVRLTPQQITQLAVLAEQACDSIMIEDRVVLFAHRRGAVLEELGCQLPPLVVIGCMSGPADGVNTLELPLAHYTQHEIETFRRLRAALREAITTQDVKLLGQIATTSAQINQRFLPKPELDFLITLSGQLGAAGVQIAHSGTVVGLIFDARLPDLTTRTDCCTDALDHEGIPQGESFTVST